MQAVRAFPGLSRCLRIAVVALALVLWYGAAQAAAAPRKAAHHAKVMHHAKVVYHAEAVHHAKVVHHAKQAHRAKVVQKVAHQAASTRAAVSTAPAPQPAPAAPTSCADGDLVPTTGDIDRIRTATLCLIGMARAANGLPQLHETANLDAAAQAHTDDMVARGYFGHVGSTGLDLLDRIVDAGYAAVDDVLGAGENIAAGSESLATPAATVASWMASAEHRANILDPSFTDTGLGVVPALPASLGIGGTGATYTQCFGAKA